MSLTLQFVPYSQIDGMSSIGKIRKLLNIAKQEKIVLLQGRLSKEEEKELIKTTMEEINKDFKGIELAVIYPGSKSDDFVKKLKTGIVSALSGNSTGLTIIGPASIVKEIRKDPTKIELFTKDTGDKHKK